MSPEEKAELVLRRFLERTRDRTYDMMVGRYGVDLTPGKSDSDFTLLRDMIAAEFGASNVFTDPETPEKRAARRNLKPHAHMSDDARNQ